MLSLEIASRSREIGEESTSTIRTRSYFHVQHFGDSFNVSSRRSSSSCHVLGDVS